MPSYTAFLAVSRDIADNKQKSHASNINEEATENGELGGQVIIVWRCDVKSNLETNKAKAKRQKEYQRQDGSVQVSDTNL